MGGNRNRKGINSDSHEEKKMGRKGDEGEQQVRIGTVTERTFGSGREREGARDRDKDGARECV